MSVFVGQTGKHWDHHNLDRVTSMDYTYSLYYRITLEIIHLSDCGVFKTKQNQVGKLIVELL